MAPYVAFCLLLGNRVRLLFRHRISTTSCLKINLKHLMFGGAKHSRHKSMSGQIYVMKPGIEILFVEDSAGDALLTSQIVAELPFRVKLTIARDGIQALMMLSDTSFRPSMIILDLSLPLISGNDVLQRNPRKDIPVVVFSASWNDVDVDRAFALGACEYLQKPMDIAAYKEVVRSMIQKWAIGKKETDEAVS